MYFWLLDVQSTVNVDGNDVSFDYINTYYEESDAMREAKFLESNEDVLQVLVVQWKMDRNGEQEVVGCIYSYLNRNHREMK